MVHIHWIFHPPPSTSSVHFFLFSRMHSPAVFLSLPAFLGALAFAPEESRWGALSAQSLLFACLTLLACDAFLRFFAKYDKATVLPARESGKAMETEGITSKLATVAPLVLLVSAISAFYVANSLLGPLRTTALLACLLLGVQPEGAHTSRTSPLILGAAFAVDCLTSTHPLTDTLLGYALLTVAYIVLCNPVGSATLDTATATFPSLGALLALTTAACVPFGLLCAPICNFKMVLVALVSLAVTIASSVDMEKLHSARKVSLASLFDISFGAHFRAKYILFNLALVGVYFINAGLVMEISSLWDSLCDLLSTHSIIILSNVAFAAFITHHDETPAMIPTDKEDNRAITFTSLLVHLFFAKDTRSIFNFLLLNLAFMFIQLLYSFRSKSLSLLSDSLHMLLDCVSLFFGLMAGAIAAKNREFPSARFPFGLSRVETLAGFTNGALLLGIVFGIYNESLQRMFAPVALENTTELLIVSFLGLLVNLVGIFAFNHGESGGHGHAHSHAIDFDFFGKKDAEVEHSETCNEHHAGHCEGHDEKHSHEHGEEHHGSHDDHDNHDHGDSHAHSHSQSHSHSHASHSHGHESGHGREGAACSHSNDNMHGIFLHILADTLGSVGVIISTIIVKITGWTLVDPVMSVLIATLILASAIPLLQSSGSNLLLSVPKSTEDDLHHLLGEVLKIRGVKSYTTPRFWPREGPNSELVGYLHVQFFKPENSSGIRTKIERLFESSASISKVHLQLENEIDDCWCRREGIFGSA